MTKRLLLGLFLVLGIATAMRCPRLGERPMHNDEAVNGIKFGQLWDGRLAQIYGPYRYDPNEHHGPVLPYLTFALSRATGAPDINRFSEARLRTVDVLFGLGLILLIPLVADALGRGAAIWAGLFIAVSPAFVFYSRYYIHEILLVFFSFLAIAAGWRYYRSHKVGWALLGGLAIGLMHATKETFVISLAAAAVALGINYLWGLWIDASPLPAKRPRPKRLDLLAALAVWAAVVVLLFSAFFTSGEGVLDSLRTYKPWLSRAGGQSPHLHSWAFYFHRLLWFRAGTGPVWSEALVLALAVVGAGAGFMRKLSGGADPVFVRFLGLYTLALTTAYSLISYKTPWCLLSFWLGMVLLAGIGAGALVGCLRRSSAKRIAVCFLVAGSGHLGWQAWRACGQFASDPANPYVYAHTLPDTLDLVKQVRELARVFPPGRPLRVQVMGADGDYWPLPWYLRGLSAGFWNVVPPGPYAPVLIVSASLHAHLDEGDTHQMPRYYEMRPGYFLELYVERNLWRDFILSQPPHSRE